MGSMLASYTAEDTGSDTDDDGGGGGGGGGDATASSSSIVLAPAPAPRSALQATNHYADFGMVAQGPDMDTIEIYHPAVEHPTETVLKGGYLMSTV